MCSNSLTTLLYVTEQVSFFCLLITLVVIVALAIKLVGIEITTEGCVFGVLEGVLREIQWL